MFTGLGYCSSVVVVELLSPLVGGEEALFQGVALLAIYSAGLGVPFLIVAGFTDRLAGRLRGVGRIGRRLHQGAGAVMVLMGVAMMTGRLSALSYWILDTFPVLGRIG